MENDWSGSFVLLYGWNNEDVRWDVFYSNSLGSYEHFWVSWRAKKTFHCSKFPNGFQVRSHVSQIAQSKQSPSKKKKKKKKKRNRKRKKQKTKETKRKKAIPVRKIMDDPPGNASPFGSVWLLQCSMLWRSFLHFRSLRRRCSRHIASDRNPVLPSEPVCPSIAQYLRLLPTFSLVYLAVSEPVSPSLCVLADKWVFYVTSINKSTSINEKLLGLWNWWNCLFLFKNAALQKFFGAQRPQDPHLQSTFIRGWLRPWIWIEKYPTVHLHYLFHP